MDNRPDLQHDNSNIEHRKNYLEKPLPPEIAKTIANGICDALQRNQQLPMGPSSSLPESVLYLKTGNAKPVFRKQYPLPQKYHDAVDKQLQEWLQHGIIKPALLDSQWNSPILAVPKKDENGKWTKTRVCIDPRGINALLEPDNFPLEDTKLLVNKVLGLEWASLLDLVWSYNQILVHPPDQIKLTITWNGARFMFVGAPFGIMHVQSVMSRFVAAALRNLVDRSGSYVDDIVVHTRSSDVNQHIQDLNDVINALTSAGLRLRVEKCQFGYSRIRLLGFIVSKHGRAPDMDKLSTFATLPTPTSGKQIQSILGVVNFLRDHIPRYAEIAAPLETLRNIKDIRPFWTASCQQALDTFKHVLSQPPILTNPDYSKPFCVGTDASQHGVGAVLYQEDNNGKRSYICFASKSLNPAQRNYPSIKRELLAIIFALRKFHHWIAGRKFKLYTDHQPLAHLFNAKDLNNMLSHWALIILQYDFEIFHRPGIHHVLEDALSCLYPPDFWSDTPFTLPNVPDSAKKPPKPKSINSKTPDLSNIELDDSNLNAPVKTLNELARDLLGKTVPPEDERQPILERLHSVGHEGAQTLMRKILKEGYFWPNLRNDCHHITRQCKECLQFNITRHGFHPLKSIHATYPFEHIAIDLTGPFQEDKYGHRYVLLVTDIATRFTILRPLKDKTAKETAKEFVKIICELGFPKIVQSDNGPEFVNEIMLRVKNRAGFDHRFISSYHPRANGAAESHVKLAKTALFKAMKGDTAHWSLFIPIVQFAINQRTSRRSDSKPFELFFGRPLNYPYEHHQAVSQLKEPATLMGLAQAMYEIVYPTIKSKIKAFANRVEQNFNKRNNLTSFNSGDKVMLQNTAAKTKTEPKFLGPYVVHRRTKNGTYMLRDTTGDLLQDNVPPSQLKLADSTAETSEDHYEIQHILSHKGPRSRRQYLVKWKGYASKNNSWVQEKDFDSQQPIIRYWKNKQRKTKQVTNNSNCPRRITKRRKRP